MTTGPQPNLLGREPAVRMYVFLCLVSLTVVVLLLWQRNYGNWSLFPGMIGLLAVVFRWRSGPLLFLAALTSFLLVQHVVIRNTAWRLLPRRTAPLSDWALCGACLAFVMAQYRLQGLVNFIFPPDPRTRSRTATQAPPRARRAVDLVTPAETGLFLLALPLWSALAQFGWGALAPNAHVLDVAPALDQLVVLAWLIGGGVLLIATLLGYVEFRRFTSAEATLFLQDTLWQQTRREQRRVARWWAWKQIRVARRKEKS
jgi:hypothetical protein